MDARELTVRYYKQKEEIADLQRKVAYLEQVVDKLELKVKDMDVDVKMALRSIK